MTKKISWKLVLAAVVGTVAVLVAVPGESLQSLLDGVKASVNGASYADLTIVLSDADNPTLRPFVHTTAITRGDADRLREMPTAVPRSDFVVEAKKKAASKRGYDAHNFGNDSFRLMGSLRLERVELKESTTGRIQTLYGRRAGGVGATD